MKVLIGLFRRIVLVDDFTNSNTMTCHLVSIRLGVLQETFGHHRTGDLSPYQELLRIFVPFPDLRLNMKAKSLKSHRWWIHGTNP